MTSRSSVPDPGTAAAKSDATTRKDGLASEEASAPPRLAHDVHLNGSGAVSRQLAPTSIVRDLLARPSLSVVVPVYNSATIFPELHRRLVAALEPCVDSFEIIAVVDGCADNSADVVAQTHEVDTRIKLIELARNFGEQAATTAGLEHARGTMIVVMDDDLEDPPEVIPQLIEKARQGYDVVYGVMRKRKASVLRRLAYHSFYRVLNYMTDETRMPNDAGSFCLMSRQVVDQLNALPETNRYIRGLRAWLGYRQIGVEYERGHRHSGTSGYSWRGYLRFATMAIYSFSYKPLRLVTWTGGFVSLLGFLWGAKVVAFNLLGFTPSVPGYVSIMVAQLFLGGIQLLSLGVIGQYISRIYSEAKRRPVYIPRRMVGFDNDH